MGSGVRALDIGCAALVFVEKDVLGWDKLEPALGRLSFLCSNVFLRGLLYLAYPCRVKQVLESHLPRWSETGFHDCL